VSLKGGRELRARLKAIRVAFKPIGREWAEDAAEIAKRKVAQNTGKTRRSFRVKNATQRKATVVGNYTAYFIDAGPVRHQIVAKRKPRLIFQAGGRTIFAKRVNHPGYRGRPFRAAAAHEALRRNPMAQGIIDQWNSAA
jgi:hypothetical protein